jgi:Ca2+-binding EF-hand superfamily protein
VHKIFEKYDGYGKGFLDRMEFLSLLKNNTDAHFSQEEIDELVEKVDTNHNNLIEESELYTMYKEVLEQKYMGRNPKEEESH